MSLGIFCLPANTEIPLHNHPGMTVLSRVLYGEMHVESYDLVGEADGPRHIAELVHDRTFHPEDPPAVLFPSSGGNIHRFCAVTDCAVLDLLSPPYSCDDGRDCTYYRMVAKGSDGRVVLEEDHDSASEFSVCEFRHDYGMTWVAVFRSPSPF